MKIIIKVSDRITVEKEVAHEQDAFKAIGTIQSSLSHTTCMVCGSSANFVHTKRQEYDFYEMWCSDTKCRHKLCLGTPQSSPDSLYPKIKDRDGNYIDHHGWHKWEGKDPDKQSSRRETVPATPVNDDDLPF